MFFLIHWNIWSFRASCKALGLPDDNDFHLCSPSDHFQAPFGERVGLLGSELLFCEWAQGLAGATVWALAAEQAPQSRVPSCSWQGSMGPGQCGRALSCFLPGSQAKLFGLFRVRRLHAGAKGGKTPRTHMLEPPPVSILAGLLPDTRFISCISTGQMENTTFVTTTTFSIQLSNA